ncbi:MAG: cytochrome c biogenesis protein CcsA [Bacteroidia bacterium]|jgi:cytochrome c-type biogenesis protein CcmF
MNELQFAGENLIFGNLGHFAVVLAFGTSILATLAYFFATQRNDETWSNIAKWAFHTHTVAVLSIVGILFYIIHQHMFEYHYAWQHSSRDLPVEYMISCFWEGQEGSFLLWIFWQMVIGNILIRTAGKWTNPVMAVVMLSQIALTSMLIGVKILGYKLGSSPFELLRVAMGNAPIFKRPDYLSKITDGNGLNPLLQNYWMVIHPPTLFFGFATTIVPYAYAVAALWKRDFTGWLKPALPWALVSVMVLGTGIIMGGFWAYESLSFGGYWAWDPVENASLIPWLILIAGMHVMLIYKHSGNALNMGFLLILTTFILVLYATFLTRSGILGNASVHSFTDLGMSGQLLVFMMLFVWLPAFVLLQSRVLKLTYIGAFILFIFGLIAIEKWGMSNWPLIILGFGFLGYNFYSLFKTIPRSEKEEAVYTREFWMFIGSLVLLISAFQIAFTTSIPVFSKLFGLNIAPPVDAISHYNRFQMPIAIMLAILTGVAQLLKFKKNTDAIKRIGIHAAIALLLTIGLMFFFELQNWFYSGLLFAALYGLSANASILLPMLKGRIRSAGSAIAHIGFGVLVIGVLVSSANKEVISINQSGQMLNPEFDEKANTEHVYLEKGKPLRMGEYEIEYVSDSTEWVNNYYQVHYKKINPKTNAVEYEFDLYPNGQINPKMGLVANPDTKHYISHDIFTYISSVPKNKSEAKYIHPVTHQMKTGDTLVTNKGYLVLKAVSSNVKDNKEIDMSEMKVLLSADFELITLEKTIPAQSIFGIQKNSIVQYPAELEEAGMRIQFTGVDPKTGQISVELADKDTSNEFIIMKAIKFPWINLVWSGTIIMIIGFLFAIFRRIDEFRKLNEQSNSDRHKQSAA